MGYHRKCSGWGCRDRSVEKHSPAVREMQSSVPRTVLLLVVGEVVV